jgi:hypothetical protein
MIPAARMIRLDRTRSARDLLPAITHLFELSEKKIKSIEETWQPNAGAPVFTVQGRYQSRGWTEWTQGFQFGSALLQFDATGDTTFLELGRSRTLDRMATHLTHTGVHDHGFNNVSTYGNLWRLADEGRFRAEPYERRLYELALAVSGAVQAARWTPLSSGGFIYSFNGAHSLFVDTIRTLRVLLLAHRLGHSLLEEQDARVNLEERALQHASTTAAYNIYFGRGRDAYDVRGRTAHESLFNAANGTYRGPGTQQGYSPFTTWTRGLAWAMLGFAELIEFFDAHGGIDAAQREVLYEAAAATSDFYIDHAAAADGIPYWDTGAPGLASMTGWETRAAEPINDFEPVDSSAAAIAAQGLVRLGRATRKGDGSRYEQAGLCVLETLINPDGVYLSTNPNHQGLLLHSVYHRPNGWDYVPPGTRVPNGESSMWGDYHLREAALYVKRIAEGAPYLTFFGSRAQ